MEEIIETYKELEKRNILDRFDLEEYQSVEYGDRISKKFPSMPEIKFLRFSSDKELNEKLCSIFNVPLENKASIPVSYNQNTFTISVFARINNYGRLEFVTDPKIGGSIKRKSKKFPNGVKLTKEMLDNSKEFKDFVLSMKKKLDAIKRYNLAIFLIELRKSGLINQENLEAIRLEREYRKLTSKEEQKKFLIKHGFSGVEENFDYEGYSKPDGYGHTTGRSMMLDFKNKTCYIASWSSDD